MNSDIKILAYYLPQYHPIPENDEWWGKGFTEWTNVAKAKPLFKGHYQPILPADLGFYDLRVPQIRIQQAELAKQYGVDGFIYYHYYFGNKKFLLEQPALDMLKSKSPDFPFCFCWANQTWKGIWHGLDNPNVLVEQLYPGVEDYKFHFEYLLPFFKDERYIKVGNKPMLHLYETEYIPDLKNFTELFNNWAIQEGFDGIYFVANFFSFQEKKLSDYGLNAQVGMDLFFKMRYSKEFAKKKSLKLRIKNKVINLFRVVRGKGRLILPNVYDYSTAIQLLENYNYPDDITYFPCVIPNWDNSSRSGNKSLIFHGSTPELWQKWLSSTLKKVQEQKQSEKFVIIKSWNEWAEGNYLEPDQKWGHEWLNAVRKVKEEFESQSNNSI